MINGFAQQTHELTDIEINRMLPGMVKRLKTKIGKNNAVTNNEIVAAFKSIGVKTGGPRIRKIINYIRMQGLVPNLIATSSGYYVASDRAELEDYIESLEQRISSITDVKNQMVNDLRLWPLK
jgi:hypothetical protein